MSNLNKIEGRTIESGQSVMSALKQMNAVRTKLLFVFNISFINLNTQVNHQHDHNIIYYDTSIVHIKKNNFKNL